MVWWLRICLPMQGMRVRSLVLEDPSCPRATNPVRHNYWACALEPGSCKYWVHLLQLLKFSHPEPTLCNKRSTATRSPLTAAKSKPRWPQPEKACRQRWRPSTAKNKYRNLKKKRWRKLFSPAFQILHSLFFSLETIVSFLCILPDILGKPA